MLKQLYKLRATAIKTPFKDCHHEDAFYTKLMKYVKTSCSLEWRRLLEHFNLSFRTSREKILEDQLIKFEMLSEHLKNWYQWTINSHGNNSKIDQSHSRYSLFSSYKSNVRLWRICISDNQKQFIYQSSNHNNISYSVLQWGGKSSLLTNQRRYMASLSTTPTSHNNCRF